MPNVLAVFERQHFNRFHRNMNECWEWNGPYWGRGYGRINFGGKGYYVHRLMWEMRHGEIPTGMQVCHHCDNPPCINPEHLFLGTPSENFIDAIKKGRVQMLPPHSMPGENHPLVKLTSEQVKIIREERKSGVSAREIARRYNVSTGHIRQIVSGNRWKMEAVNAA